MTPRGALHPERLPWFAAGRLDRSHAAEIERHVRTCDACRAEVEALRSVYRGLRLEALPNHVSSVRLVAYHARDPEVTVDERRIVEEHVRTCHACSMDLMALERADASMRPQHGRRIVGAAASVLIAVALGWQLASWNASSSSSAAVTRVVFQAAQRGTGAERLIGAGPWELEIWLPLHASAPAYRARIYRSDDPSKTILETSVAPGPQDAPVRWLVPKGLLRPGHHALVLIPSGDDGAGTEIRGFEVESSP